MLWSLQNNDVSNDEQSEWMEMYKVVTTLLGNDRFDIEFEFDEHNYVDVAAVTDCSKGRLYIQLRLGREKKKLNGEK